jgi:xanthine dehydrogenase small subunit
MSLGELVGLAAEWPEAQLLAGGTDVGLWVTKQHRQLDTVIYIGNVPELRRIQVSATHVEIGAAVTFSEAAPVLTAHYPDLDELLRRFASPPIRNVATVGGNVANGSPIGDSMPALIALGATVLLRGRDGARELDLEDYYLDYQQTARAPGEVLERVRVPLPAPAAQLRAYKVSKRLDQDISAVCGAFRLVREGGRVREIRIAYGGLAAIPKRAVACERSLAGAAWSERAVREAMDALDEDFTPISDMRASARYRRAVARNLLMRLYLETDGDPGWVRVYDHGRHGRSVA